MKQYKTISLDEREQIVRLSAQGFSERGIAKILGRNQSTISRELRRIGMNRFTYQVSIAHVDRNSKLSSRGRRKKLTQRSKLLEFVKEKLIRKRWSPEQISGYLKINRSDGGQKISHETIYKYIYSIETEKERKKWVNALRRKRKRRRSRCNNRNKRGQIPNRISIHERPIEIELRSEPGHWEGDLLIGKNHGSAIGSIVERSSRYTKIVKLEERNSNYVVSRFKEELVVIPTKLKKSLTYDNGHEFTEHEYFTESTGMKVYFADPGCPGQRGTNENTNGLIRNFFPKGTDFHNISEEELKEVELLLNQRPRKILGYKTPERIFKGLIKNGLSPPNIDPGTGKEQRRPCPRK